MPKSLPAVCRRCGAKRRDGAAISRRGLCMPCGNAGVEAAIITQMQNAGATAAAIERKRRELAS